jgi:hypothetical protein
MLFLNFFRKILFLLSLHVQNAMQLDVFWPISNNFSVYHTRESPPPHCYCSAGFDWLGVDLEVRSLCYWPIPQTGIQRIE